MYSSEAFSPNTPNSHLRKENQQPCAIYFTDQFKECDDGAYLKHRSVFELEKYRLETAVQARGGTPTTQENDRLRELNQILLDYEASPDGTNCKIEVPGWHMYQNPGEDRIVYGNLQSNKTRGPPEHWAYCYTIGKKPTSPPLALAEDPFTIQGETWWRGSFTSFQNEALYNALCAGKKAKDMRLPNAMVLEFPQFPSDVTPSVRGIIVDGRFVHIQDVLKRGKHTHDDIFRLFFGKGSQHVTGTALEKLTWTNRESASLVQRVYHKICGNQVNFATTQSVSFMIHASVIVKETRVKYLKGTYEVLAQTQQQFERERTRAEKHLRNVLKTIRGIWTAIVAAFALPIGGAVMIIALRKKLRTLDKEAKRLRAKIQDLKMKINNIKNMRKQMRTSFASWVVRQLQQNQISFHGLTTENASYDRCVYLAL